ncbi:MAG: HPF/RaiA family ribosome-associated protein [Acholeplasmatales bacterium]|jgi:ribosome-associated translation inhibitor RaiA|nr:HPF/RaiA family ribosome-associated protein [Acholeplasmatales bacterium]
MAEKKVKVQYVVEAEHFKFGDNLKELTEGYLQKLTKFLNQDIDAKVKAKRPNNPKINDLKIEITINGFVRTEVQTKFPGIEKALKQALQKLKSQINKYYIDKNKDKKNFVENYPIEEKEVFVKEKLLILDSISREEALKRMQASGHELFYIYRDIDTSKVCVIYKRNLEGYGIIQTA